MSMKPQMKTNIGRINFIQPLDPMLSPERFDPVKVVPLMPNFGARIEGLDLREAISEAVKAKLREAFLRFGVLFFSDQERLSEDKQIEVTRIFGAPDEGSPFIPKRAKNVDVLITDASNPPYANLWHSDNSGLPHASFGTLIQIQECPPVGGNTAWCSTQKAYECLSDHMKRCLEGLVAIHYWDKRGQESMTSTVSYDDDDSYYGRYFEYLKKFPPQKHPVVRTHPITGRKSIFVNEVFTTFIEGLHTYESQGILAFLYNWLHIPEFQLFHHWQRNDVAVWDNISMVHYALGDYQEHRVNQRVEFAIDPELSYAAEAAFSNEA
ncbi:TauD/TfdA family dioxygenase [Ramlibacter sp. WS9]|uniref:TauD/TfdA dioxygenase family protein n=1 Tax=Ramlibacter sp. WS9 TaxID=1882741 RepID=UPI001144514E|nr:TauD/TfdA family dioxygenase [Ramlibacter sp. WS9]ROZ71320.1 taurine catabolism dioxygenase TauD [Ramlibacter sp. WS9]